MSTNGFTYETPIGRLVLRPNKKGVALILDGEGVAWYQTAEAAAEDLRSQVENPEEHQWSGFENNDDRLTNWAAYADFHFPDDLSGWEREGLDSV